MSIPVHLQSFKSSGIYRLTFDKSTILNQDASIMRLVVGYSEKGPFNTPVYIKSISDFKAVYGDVSKKMEKRGICTTERKRKFCNYRDVSGCFAHVPVILRGRILPRSVVNLFKPSASL